MVKRKTLNHHCCYPGKRVMLKLRSGEIIIGKFVERRAPRMTIRIDDNERTFLYKDILQFKIVKTAERTPSNV